MQTVSIVIHAIITLSLILIILAQQSNSDGLSSIAGGGSNSGLLSGKAASSFLTKVTYILAAMFLINSLILANIANKSVERKSIIKEIEAEESHHKVPVAK